MIKHNSDFKRKFGHVLYHEPGGLMYHPKDINNYFFFPESVKEEHVEQLMERCVKENKDLIFDLVKNNRVVYKPGCLY